MKQRRKNHYNDCKITRNKHEVDSLYSIKFHNIRGGTWDILNDTSSI